MEESYFDAGVRRGGQTVAAALSWPIFVVLALCAASLLSWPILIELSIRLREHNVLEAGRLGGSLRLAFVFVCLVYGRIAWRKIKASAAEALTPVTRTATEPSSGAASEDGAAYSARADAWGILATVVLFAACAELLDAWIGTRLMTHLGSVLITIAPLAWLATSLQFVSFANRSTMAVSRGAGRSRLISVILVTGALWVAVRACDADSAARQYGSAETAEEKGVGVEDEIRELSTLGAVYSDAAASRVAADCMDELQRFADDDGLVLQLASTFGHRWGLENVRVAVRDRITIVCLSHVQRGFGNLEAVLRTAVRNLLNDQYRRERRWQYVDERYIDRDHFEQTPDLGAADEQSRKVQCVEQARASLSSEDQELLAIADEFGTKEVAERLGIAYGRADDRVQNARKRLIRVAKKNCATLLGT